MDVADRLAEAPITRQAVGFLSYEEAMAWIGNGVGTIDPKRKGLPRCQSGGLRRPAWHRRRGVQLVLRCC